MLADDENTFVRTKNVESATKLYLLTSFKILLTIVKYTISSLLLCGCYFHFPNIQGSKSIFNPKSLTSFKMIMTPTLKSHEFSNFSLGHFLFSQLKIKGHNFPKNEKNNAAILP